MNFLTRCKYVGQVGRNGKKYVTNFDTWLDGIKKGQIQENPKNRSIDMRHVQTIYEGFDFNSFGEVIGIEFQEPNGLIFQQRSAHHRNKALLMVDQERQGLGSDGQIPVYINVFPTEEAARMYVTEGNTKRLSVQDLLVNSDYAFCNILNPILKSVSIQPYRGASFFTPRSLPVLANIILAMHRQPNSFETKGFGSIWNNTKEIRSLSGIVNGDPEFTVKLSTKAKHNLLEAITYAVTVAQEIIDQGDTLKGRYKNATLSEQAAKVLKSKTFFMFLVWDKLIGGQVTSILPSTLARTLVEKKSEFITNALNALNSKDMIAFSKQIYAIARTKAGIVKKEKEFEL